MNAPAQLSLGFPPTAPDELTFFLGLPNREGASAYVHLIRAEDDPDETMARGAGKREVGWWKRIGTDEEWAAKIAAHMEDGVPRTANRIAVELTGTTIDIFFGKAPDAGLWLAVERGELAWTATAPIRFVHRRALVEVPT
jgi:hypothetical protein